MTNSLLWKMDDNGPFIDDTLWIPLVIQQLLKMINLVRWFAHYINDGDFPESFLYVYQRVNMMILPSMDWFKGRITGKQHIWREIPMVSCRFPLKPIHWYLWKLVTFHFASSRGQRRFPGTVGVPNGRNGRPRWGQKRCFSSPESAFFFTTNRAFKQELRLHMI